MSDLVAVLSDIHANRAALQAVLQDVGDLGATEMWFLGDLYGYFASAAYMYEDLVTRDQLPLNPYGVVAGNHDWGVIGKISLTEFNDLARKPIRDHTEIVQGEPHIQEWLKQLPTIASPRAGVYLAHGAFSQEELYRVQLYCDESRLSGHIFPNDNWQSLCRLLREGPVKDFRLAKEAGGPPCLMLVGHTHRQGIWQRDHDNGHWKKLYQNSHLDPSQLHEWRVDLQPTPDRPVLANPGSVGKPGVQYSLIDGYLGAEYLVLEITDTGIRVRFRWVPYLATEEFDKMNMLGYEWWKQPF
jgi:predicted phosphodiesterase